jgi:hypothetical protein
MVKSQKRRNLRQIIPIKTDSSFFDPEQIADIDLSRNIVLCVLESNKNILIEDYAIYLLNQTDILFHNQKLLMDNNIIINYNPFIKWSIPKGIELVVKEPIKKQSVFNNIFINYISYDKLLNNDLANVNFTIYINKDRSKGLTKISSGEKLLEVNYFYKLITNEEMVDNIYIIQNNYAYQEFNLHFNK